MVRKIKFMIVAVFVFSFGYSLLNIDWKLTEYRQPNIDDILKETPLHKKYEDVPNKSIIKKIELGFMLRYYRLILETEYRYIGSIRYYKNCFVKLITSHSTWFKSFILAFTMVFSPLLIRAILYWYIAPILNTRTLLFDNGNIFGKTSICGEGEKNLKVEVQPNSSLIVVNERFVNDIEASTNLKASIRWLFSWRYPIMSFFCKLRCMNEYKNTSQTSAYIDVTSNDPDDYFIEIDLNDCEGAFVVPSKIKAFSPTLNIKCKWRLFSLISWIIFRPRYYVVSGTGKLVLSSTGGFANRKATNNYIRRKPSSLIFADVSLKWNATRTELWYPYIIGNGELFDLRILGEGNYLIQNTVHSKEFSLTSPESVLNVLGKLAGF